jgi:hypothetical protein
MRFVEGDEAQAWCERRGAVDADSMAPVGAQAP